ncbi:MAG: SRPBCC domain-containing protein [Polyangiaceae bacterium]|nr:SRPBCC domain-containing protein [Polyangiaceae bacterium]
MKLEGDYLFEAPVTEVWDALMDPVVLAAVMPGCDKLELIDGQYVGELNIKIGPVQGKFSGKVALKDVDEPQSYTMTIDGRGPTGFVKATAAVKLEPEGKATRLRYDADAQIGGKIATVGQRLLDAASKAIAKQSLDGLHVNVKARAAAAEEEAAAAASEAAEEKAAPAPAAAPDARAETPPDAPAEAPPEAEPQTSAPAEVLVAALPEPSAPAGAALATLPEPSAEAGALSGTPPEPNAQAEALSGTPPEPSAQAGALSGTPPEPSAEAGALAGTPPEPVTAAKAAPEAPAAPTPAPSSAATGAKLAVASAPAAARQPRQPVAVIKTDQAAFAANVAKEVSKSLVPPPVLYAVAIGVIVFVLWLASR